MNESLKCGGMKRAAGILVEMESETLGERSDLRTSSGAIYL